MKWTIRQKMRTTIAAKLCFSFGLAVRCEAVNEGMQAQATGAEQISQSSEAIDGLNQVSSLLHGGVSRFKLVA